MSIQVALEHRTTYRFDRTVEIGPHVVRLRPAPHTRTPILSYSLTVTPATHFVNWHQDPFGNHLARFVFPERAAELELVVDLVADLTIVNPFDFFLEESAERFPFAYDDVLARDLAPYLHADPATPLMQQWLSEVERPIDGTPTTAFLYGLNSRLANDVGYTIRMEPGVQTPEQTLLTAKGSCRDSAWLEVQLLRHLGLAARFASGYLVQLRPDDTDDGPAEDFTDLHAWAEVYVPGAGWIGLDPTSGLFAGEGHIPLACTPAPTSAAPVTGATGPCTVTFDYGNVVRRVVETPRVTLPYRDAQWSEIDALGHEVDRRLTTADVRLTMGGEPTFVAADGPDDPEWTVAADGPVKRAKSVELARRLQQRLAPNGLIHHGQGKWYPGEPLPRWQLTILWRADGESLWTRPDLLADPFATGESTARDAHALAVAIAERLALPADCVVPAFEDALAADLADAQQPLGPPTLEDPGADDAPGEPAGWVMALHHTGTRWATTRWTTRRGRIVLVGGDSPLGLRLPLASLAWAPADLPPDRSTFEPRGPLPKSVLRQDALVVDPSDAPTTALCTQVRDGNVHVFLPPLTEADQAVVLLRQIEAAAAATDIPVVIEGYPPAGDPRLTCVVVAPDPGVIEVNVQPAATWDDLVSTTTALYDDARALGLATETFALDGTHTGTGGGNHLTLGAATPADSPVLRRPDLLRSLVTYWQHHPSLSYLFSGRFIGPTSQAPRVDEGRHDALRELEISFAELDRLGDDLLPWHVDRLFRNLLVDVTGNTHRAEFCIDKLFSPDSERGRLGLVELRGFEMPPHARMALVQALLVRALVVRLWDDPYHHPLVRWGTHLHDRFLLPHFVTADIADVCADLATHDLPVDPDWFAPFLEFRFPLIGRVEVSGVEVELRAAIEPWPVLGEEISGQGTSRYVDSSLERLQVAVRGATQGRHVVTVNGVAVPLRATSSSGALIAAVRYRAWQPPSCLHPTIEVHAPLVIDVLDRWTGRSLGGCTYHVAHPGGRNYERRPVNSAEAESRRVSRFFAAGHTPGPVAEVPEPPDDPEYPHTLDLRRSSPG